MSLWWPKASIPVKERAILILNRRAFSLGEIRRPALFPELEWQKYRDGLLFGEELKTFYRKCRDADQPLHEAREQLATVMEWRNGSRPLPPDIRRCTYCSKYFLVKHRANKQYCDPKTCGAYHRMKKKKGKDRERKLARVRDVLKGFRRMPDWKQRAARRSGVTPHFITHAIRRGELKLGGPKKGKTHELRKSICRS
jgi:hypothetical protein